MIGLSYCSTRTESSWCELHEYIMAGRTGYDRSDSYDCRIQVRVSMSVFSQTINIQYANGPPSNSCVWGLASDQWRTDPRDGEAECLVGGIGSALRVG
jgi:hypothetical protein